MPVFLEMAPIFYLVGDGKKSIDVGPYVGSF